MNLRRKPKSPKSLRLEQIADLFLRHLATVEGGGVEGKAGLLDEFLDSIDVFYDYSILQQVIDLLLERGLVKGVPGVSSSIGYILPAEPAISDEGRIMPVTQYLSSIEGTIIGCEITGKGKHYVDQGQELDIQGINERKEDRKKWKERFINFIVALITATCVVALTEPVKRWLAPPNQQSGSNVRSDTRK